MVVQVKFLGEGRNISCPRKYIYLAELYLDVAFYQLTITQFSCSFYLVDPHSSVNFYTVVPHTWTVYMHTHVDEKATLPSKGVRVYSETKYE